MTLKHGFKHLRTLEIDELSCTAEVYRHEATGGRLLSVVSSDENKVFGVGFRTPPADSTGLPHILEHSVLCGSRKYPVKEPFVELLKGSLQTFLNALTFPDKTCYPVASANEQDFRNLVDVYLDAVFFPRLTPAVLSQEGWHFELRQEEGGLRLTRSGVVLGEMKGSYSSPDSLLMELTQQSLFPDTTYGLDSGGDPERIPELTFEAFEAFHRRHYHPSNAYAFFSGDDDPDWRLEKLDEYFSQFAAAEPGPAVGLQPAPDSPARVERAYAASAPDGQNGQGGQNGQDGDRRGYMTINVCLGETADADLNLALHALEHVLIGLPSSRLRKALTDSGLGEDLAGVGLETDLRQMYFSVGLKGMNPADEAKVEQVVRQTLEEMARGVTAEEAEAALNSLEFALRENNTGSFPRGLALWFRALSTWLYDEDPLLLLPFEARLAGLRQRVGAGEPVFETMIRELLLDNPHRSTVLLVPDEGLGQRQRRAERDELDALLQGMGEADLEAVRRAEEELRAFQETPDDPEALAAIPRLEVEDMPRRNQRIPLEIYESGESRTLYHELDTNGIVYLDLGFDLRFVPDRLVPYVPLFGRALKEMGTRKSGYGELLNRIARTTGGIEPQTLSVPVRDSDEAACALLLRGKATAALAPELLDILSEMVFEVRLDDAERFGRMVLEAKARAEQRMVPAGHMAVLTRLRALDPEGAAHQAHVTAERMSGVSQLFFLRELAGRVASDWGAVLADLEELRVSLLCRDALLVNVTGEEEGFTAILKGLSDFYHAMPEVCVAPQARTAPAYSPVEGLEIPARVNYVGKGVNLARLGVDPGLASGCVVKHLRTGWLWEQVRVRGGAYGAFCALDRLGGHLCMVSYRDPNLDRTLEVFEGAAAHLEGLALTKEDLSKAVVGAIGEMDAHMLPDAKGFASLVRLLTGEDEEYRQEVREAVLSCGPRDFARFAEALSALRDQGHAVVMGPSENLDESTRKFSRVRVL